MYRANMNNPFDLILRATSLSFPYTLQHYDHPFHFAFLEQLLVRFYFFAREIRLNIHVLNWFDGLMFSTFTTNSISATCSNV